MGGGNSAHSARMGGCILGAVRASEHTIRGTVPVPTGLLWGSSAPVGGSSRSFSGLKTAFRRPLPKSPLAHVRSIAPSPPTAGRPGLMWVPLLATAAVGVGLAHWLYCIRRPTVTAGDADAVRAILTPPLLPPPRLANPGGGHRPLPCLGL